MSKMAISGALAIGGFGCPSRQLPPRPDVRQGWCERPGLVGKSLSAPERHRRDADARATRQQGSGTGPDAIERRWPKCNSRSCFSLDSQKVESRCSQSPVGCK